MGGVLVVAFAGIHAKDVRLDLISVCPVSAAVYPRGLTAGIIILRTVWTLVVIISDRLPPDMNTRRAALP